MPSPTIPPSPFNRQLPENLRALEPSLGFANQCNFLAAVVLNALDGKGVLHSGSATERAIAAAHAENLAADALRVAAALRQ